MTCDPSAADDEALARKLYEQELLEEERRRKMQEESDAEIARQLAQAEAAEQQQQQQQQQLSDDASILLADELLAQELLIADDAAMAQYLVTANDKTAVLGDQFFVNELLADGGKQKQNQKLPKPAGLARFNKEIGGSTAATITNEQRRILTQLLINETYTDLHELFMLFNQIYFDNRLDMVEVRWSNKMTLCAGTCTFRTGGYCTVALSEPLLKFRPKIDLVETLLHEMIHALLFITSKNTDRDGHGPPFLAEAERINNIGGVNITVYHSFHDEVKHYRVHAWKCNGVCQNRSPYFGVVRRAMNRPPQKADSWFAQHQADCGGTFIKISEPAKPSGKGEKRKQSPSVQSNKLTNYIVIDPDDDGVEGNSDVKGKKKKL